MKNILITTCLLFISIIAVAQSTWVENRKLFEVTEKEKEYPQHILFRSISYDFKYIDSEFVCDVTHHQITRTGNDDAVQNNNRIYISMSNTIELLNVQSRAINKDGKITILDQKNIKEIEDEENDGGYKIFAVEGAEVGGEIEYRYVKRVSGRVFLSDYIQYTSPVKQLQFSVTSPENLEFDFFTVNDTTEIIEVESSDKSHFYQGTFKNIPAFVNEGFSGGNSNKKRIDFKLAYNTIKNRQRINTFSEAGKAAFEKQSTLSKIEEKKVKEFINQNDIKSKNKIERLKNFEHQIKTKFYSEEYASSDLVEFFENGYGEQRAFVKLFVQLLDYLEIPFELVITSDRSVTKLYEEFDSWNYLSDYLLYLPEQKVYLSPGSMFFRYGYVPPEHTGLKGLFVKEQLITDFYYPVTSIRAIPADDYHKNMNNLDISVSFDKELTQSSVSLKRTYTGIESTYYKFALLRMDKEKKNEMLDEMVRYIGDDAEILNMKVDQGETSAKGWNEPFVMTAEFNSESYLEQAGNSLLFSVGKLIGSQSELYQEDERVYDIENSNNRGYLRRIEVEIPTGYTIQNAEDLIINEKVKEGDEVLFLFDSKYSIKDRKLIIEINEFYNKIYFPLKRFEEFRTVINAAADFNKVTLVMKK